MESHCAQRAKYFALWEGGKLTNPRELTKEVTGVRKRSQRPHSAKYDGHYHSATEPSGYRHNGLRQSAHC